MKKLAIISITSLILCLSCTEKGEDIGWEIRNRQQKAKTGLLAEFGRLFNLAWENPEKAEQQLARLYEKSATDIPVMEKDPELLANKEYVSQAIAMAKYWMLVTTEMSQTDYTRVDLAKLVPNFYEYRVIPPPSDIGLLLQYVARLNKLSEGLEEKWRNYPVRNEELEKSIQEKTRKKVTEVRAKINSYPEYTGKEGIVEGSRWNLIKYSVAQEWQPNVDPFTEEGISDVSLRFEADRKMKCDSIFLPYFATPYGAYSSHVLLRQRAAPPFQANYRAGKEIKGEGTYYLGNRFLTLHFHLIEEDFDMVIVVEYNDETLKESQHGKIVPIRDFEYHSSHQPIGNTRTFLSVIDAEKHHGTAQVQDNRPSSVLYGSFYLFPFAWKRMDK